MNLLPKEIPICSGRTRGRRHGGQLAAMDAANDRKTGDLIAPKGTVPQSTLDYERAMREVKYGKRFRITNAPV